MYDVEGSIVGVEELVPKEVHLSHEMGGTIFSERLVGTIIEGGTGAVAQDTTFIGSSATIAAVPMVRLLGIQVITSVTSRILNCACSVRGEVGGVDLSLPVWVWDGTNEDIVRCNIASGIVDTITLRPQPEYTLLPNLLIGPTQAITINRIHMRGTTSSFGAGTVTITLRVYVAFPELEASGVSSAGLPIPSW